MEFQSTFPNTDVINIHLSSSLNSLFLPRPSLNSNKMESFAALFAAACRWKIVTVQFLGIKQQLISIVGLISRSLFVNLFHTCCAAVTRLLRFSFKDINLASSCHMTIHQRLVGRSLMVDEVNDIITTLIAEDDEVCLTTIRKEKLGVIVGRLWWLERT